MKFRKEYLIFIIVIIVLIAVILIPKLKKSDNYFDSDNVSITYDSSNVPYSMELEESEEDYQESLVEEDYDIIQNESEEGHNESLVEEDYTTPQEEIIENSDTSLEEDYTVPQEDMIESSDIELLNNYLTSDTSVQALVMYYVCNLYNEDYYKKYYTESLIKKRDTVLTEVPYTYLSGVMTYDDLHKEGDIVYLTVVDKEYKFRFEVTDGKISSIEYVE